MLVYIRAYSTRTTARIIFLLSLNTSTSNQSRSRWRTQVRTPPCARPAPLGPRGSGTFCCVCMYVCMCMVHLYDGSAWHVVLSHTDADVGPIHPSINQPNQFPPTKTHRRKAVRWADPALLEDEYQFYADRPVGASSYILHVCTRWGGRIGFCWWMCGYRSTYLSITYMDGHPPRQS